MKNLILPIFFSVFFLLVASSNTYAQSSDCWSELNNEESVCAQSTEKCNACIGQKENPGCAETCNKATDGCAQAVEAFHVCLGVDKNPLTLQPVKPGHLSCEEWKLLLIVGTAQNCTVPAWSLPKKYLKCLSSVEEILQEMNHPIDYVLDFDENSCNVTADDLRQIKRGLPLTSRSSAVGQKSQDPNPISKFVRDVQNYFKPSGVNNGKVVKPDFSVDKPPFKEAKAVNPAQAINSWIEEVFGEAAPVIQISDPETLNRVPKLTDQAVSEVKQKSDPQKSPYQIPVLNGEAAVKLPGSNDWTPLKEGDKIVPGSTIFTGMDSTTLLMIRDKGIIEVLPFTEITVSEQGLEQAGKEGKTSTDVILHTGEVEINVESLDKGMDTTPSFPFQIRASNYTVGVRGTHFWVSQDDKTGSGVVGVYKGTVDVKNTAGSGKTISPKGDKPEVVVVTQKLSIVKLVPVGLIIFTIIGGIVFFLKKKKNNTRKH